MNNFLKIFIPLLVSFCIGALINQSDLYFLGLVGPVALAAYNIPNRLMIIDKAIALAIGPLLSIQIAKSSKEELSLQTKKSWQYTLVIGLILSVLGLLIYPILLEIARPNAEIYKTSIWALMILTICIPFRLLNFVSTMMLSAQKKTTTVIKIRTFELFLDTALNYIFSISMGLGAKGIFVATGASSLFIQIYFVYKLFYYNKSFHLLPWKTPLPWLKDITKKTFLEFSRIILLQMISYLTFVSFTYFSHRTIDLSILSTSSELYFLISMPIIALMRSLAIYQASYQNSEKIVLSLKNYSLWILIALLALVWFTKDHLAESFYGLSSIKDSWWDFGISILILTFPLFLLNRISESKIYAQEHYLSLFTIHLSSQSLSFCVALFLAWHRSEGFYLFASLLINEIILLIYFYTLKTRDKAFQQSGLLKRV